MAYIEFKPILKKVNLKPGGKKEIVLEVSDSCLDGKLDKLSEMIDQKISASFESEIVTYNIQINARTNQPLTSYKVDDRGVVHEVKPEGEQLEAFPPAEVPIKEEQEELEKQVIDEFIRAGLGVTYEDLPYDSTKEKHT